MHRRHRESDEANGARRWVHTANEHVYATQTQTQMNTSLFSATTPRHHAMEPNHGSAAADAVAAVAA